MRKRVKRFQLLKNLLRQPKRSQGPSLFDSLIEPTHQLLLCFNVFWSDAMKSQPREIRKTFFRKQVDETALS